jgi:homoserine O-acetyltransferase
MSWNTQFHPEKAGVLPTARLSYKTLGKLNPDRSNAVLVPNWYTGSHVETEMFLVGPDRALDPGKYFIVVTGLLGTGFHPHPATRRRTES